MTRLSVVIPSFSRVATVCDAVDSVLQQRHKADQVVVFDDGWADNTAEALDKCRDDLTVIRQTSQGVSAACNAVAAQLVTGWSSAGTAEWP
jgi:glycosyltransferase involved in cell wall biosynthesis